MLAEVQRYVTVKPGFPIEAGRTAGEAPLNIGLFATPLGARGIYLAESRVPLVSYTPHTLWVERRPESGQSGLGLVFLQKGRRRE